MAVIWISTGRNVGELNGSRAKMDLFFWRGVITNLYYSYFFTVSYGILHY
jgi:hypothetical protein